MAICSVCPHHCNLTEGKTGLCRARMCSDGKIVSTSYGKITSIALDPIEKKPLKLFHPGMNILSIGSFGCNMRCPFCQNDFISQVGADGVDTETVTPAQIASIALRMRSRRNIGVAFTYNEPLVGYEFVRDTSRLVKENGMLNVLVSNGMAEEAVFDEVLEYIDALNIDLKCFTEEGYRSLGGNLETVMQNIESCIERKKHLELTTLIVPGLNDKKDEIERECRWIASLDRGTVLHVTRFFPRFLMRDREATPVATVYHLADVARQYLDNVFVGNC